MPDFEITSPDGKKFVVTAPEGASQADILAYARNSLSSGQEMSSPRGSMPSIDQDREVGFVPRLAASLKMTPEGKSDFLKKIGYDTVTDSAGVQYVRDGKTMYPVNKRGFTANDIADIGGDVAQAIPTAIVGNNPLTVAGAGAAGNAVRQGISTLMPGDDSMTPADRLKSLTIDTTLAGGGQATINKALGGTLSGAAKTIPLPQGQAGPPVLDAGGADWFRPKNFLQRMISKASESSVAQNADDISKETGIQFSPGQKTQSKGLLTLEGMLRRNPMSADRWNEFDQAQLGKATEYLAKTLDSIRPGEVGPAVAGGSVARTFDDVLKGALKMRSSQARADFDAVDAASGGQPIFGTMNTVKTIDDIIAKFDTPGGGDASAALVNKLKSLRAEFLPPAPPVGGNQVSSGLQGTPMALTGSQMQRLLQIYGDAARGTGQVFTDIDKGQQRLIARNVMDGLFKDLEDAKAMGGASERASNALEAARTNYKANSKAINDMENNVLGRVFGDGFDKAPERVAEAFRNMRGSEIKSAFDLLEKGANGAETAAQVKRYLIEDAMRAAGTNLPGSNAPQAMKLGQDAFSPAKFNTAIKKSPVWDVLSGDEKFQMTTAFKAMERLAERAGTEGSPTAPLNQAWDMVKTIFTPSPASVAGGIAGLIAPGKASDALLTAEGRRALTQVSTTSPASKSFSSGMAYLTALTNKDEPSSPKQ